MRTLKNWTAKRAGGRITVYGLDPETGAADKVVGVNSIIPSPGGGSCVADVKDGSSVKLLVGSAA